MAVAAQAAQLVAAIRHLEAPRHEAATSAWRATEALSAHALTAE
jgi:hypothetical protein